MKPTLRMGLIGMGIGGTLAGIMALLLSAVLKPGVTKELFPSDTTPFAVPMQHGDLIVEVPIRRGTTLGGVLNAHGLPTQAIREAALPIYDLVKIRPDRVLEVVYVPEHDVPEQIRYRIDDDRLLLVSMVDGTWTAEEQTTEYSSEVEVISFDMNRSLWEDGLEAGLRPGDLVRLATIFEYEIDFNTELQAGSHFDLVADRLTSTNGEGRSKLGEIYAAKLDTGKKKSVALRYEYKEKVGYYHPDGSGMKRAFLRSPLEFSRVTSGFNPRRFHPILKKRRPHNGTDFGAPTGTPVRTVAEGQVIFAGTSGGHGRFVKIKHEGGYMTSYSHLSRISVRRGARVKQGQRVGAVGQSGLATGPHLHYQMWKNGRYVDAMRITLPNSAPLPKAQIREFQGETKPWLDKLPSR